MENKPANLKLEKKPKKNALHVLYQIYHFIAKIILYSLLIILILIAIIFLLYFIDEEKNIKEGKNKPPLFGAYVIVSPSMVPTIQVEDAVIIKRMEEREYKVGDIITFYSTSSRYSGLTVTHRIVGIEKSEKGKILFRTKGDNNNTEDDTLTSYDNVYGKVILKIPKIGYLQYFLLNSYGLILLVFIPCLGIIIYDLLKLIRIIFRKKV